MTVRLPDPGGDDGTWGDILNSYLEVSHSSDGTLASNTVGTNQIQNNAVTNAQLDNSTQTAIASAASKYAKPAGGIPSTDLTSSIQTSLGKADTAEQTTNKGVAGGYAGLDGSALLPTTQLPSSVVSEHVITLGNRSTDYALSLTGFLDTLLTVTLTGNWTLSFTGTIVPGTTVTLEFTQDGTGSRIVTLPTLNVTYPFGAFAINSAASSATVITFYTPDGTNWRAFKGGAELSLGYSATAAAIGNDPRLLTGNPPPKAHGGLLAWTFHPQQYSASFAFSPNNLILMKLWVPSPLTITNIVTYYQAAGTVPTSGQCFVALYDSTGTRLAVSADFSGAAAGAGLITGTGLQTIPLSSPYSWAGGQDAYLYVAFLVNASTTPKLMVRAMNSDSVWANIACAVNAPQCATFSGQTSAPTSVTLSSLALTNAYPWLALS